MQMQLGVRRSVRALQAKHTAAGGPPPVVHSEAWWLDSVTRQMVEQRLNLSGMLTFTLRGGKPINLTREQVPLAKAALYGCRMCADLHPGFMALAQEVRPVVYMSVLHVHCILSC